MKKRFYISKVDGSSCQVLDSVSHTEVCVVSDFEGHEDHEERAQNITDALNEQYRTSATKKIVTPATKFWACHTDEVSEDLLPWGADGPVRMAVQEAIEKMTGLHVGLASGWHNGGQERRSDISFAWNEAEDRDSLLAGAPVERMSELRKAWLDYRRSKRKRVKK